MSVMCIKCIPVITELNNRWGSSKVAGHCPVVASTLFQSCCLLVKNFMLSIPTDDLQQWILCSELIMVKNISTSYTSHAPIERWED